MCIVSQTTVIKSTLPNTYNIMELLTIFQTTFVNNITEYDEIIEN